jgi:hypothetical protein
MSRKQLMLVFGLSAVLLVAVIIVIGSAVSSTREYRANLPTATPPPPEVVDCRVLGGQIYLIDQDVIQILEEEYQLRCKAEYMGSFQMVAPETSYAGVDAVWTGSVAAYNEMKVNHPRAELDSDNIFVTFLMNFTWKSHLESSLQAGFVSKSDSAYVMDMQPLVEGILRDQTWADVGAPGIPGYINFRFSAPESSGGGLSSLYLLGAYITPRNPGAPPRPLRATDMDTMLPQLRYIWEAAGKQSGASPDNFDEFVTKGYPWVISSESLFIGWFNTLSAREQEQVLNNIVGVYPEPTMSTDHRLVALTPVGQKLLDAFRHDTRLQEIGWNKYGMRLGIGGIGAKPGDTPLPWILSNPNVIPDPKDDVTAVVKPVLK